MDLVYIRSDCGGFWIGYKGWMSAYYPCGTHRREGWCGQCYSNLRGRSNYSGHARHASRKVPCKMPLRKPPAVLAARLGLPPSSWQGGSLSAFSNLMEFLFSASFEDGSSRVPGTLQLCSSQGRVQVKLRDLEAKIYCFVTADTVDDALMTADAMLGDGSGDWRKDDWPGKKPQGK